MPGDPLSQPERPTMRETLRLVYAEQRKPHEHDAPPPSTFPPTRASREARRYDHSAERQQRLSDGTEPPAAA